MANLSARTEYACTAVLELALNYESGQPVQIRAIAERHGIPPQFLVQILLQLKSAGLVTSTRGVAGGYRLAHEPSQISLGDVRGVIEGRIADPVSNAGAESAVASAVLNVWRQVAAAEREILDAVTFADLAQQVTRFHEVAQSMYYI
jgi:Rrf2 family protein